MPRTQEDLESWTDARWYDESRRKSDEEWLAEMRELITKEHHPLINPYQQGMAARFLRLLVAAKVDVELERHRKMRAIGIATAILIATIVLMAVVPASAAPRCTDGTKWSRSFGKCVHPPYDYMAVCKDGSSSVMAYVKGACRGHGGVDHVQLRR